MFIEGAAISHNANNDYLERLYVNINVSAGAFCCLDANKGYPNPPCSNYYQANLILYLVD